jgi:tetratricopeptide (TPR) repeat protein
VNREARRRFARFTLAGLLALHLAAFGLYLLNESQFAFLGHWRDGREAWRTGRLSLAVTELRVFAQGYRDATRPFLMRRDFPTEAQAWSAVGNVAAAHGELRGAVDAFHQAAQLGQTSAWRERHELLWTLRDATALEAQGRERLADGNPEARQDLAAAAWLRGDSPSALREYSAALAALPRWLDQQQRPRQAADGGLVDEQLALYLLAGTTAWLSGDQAKGEHYCKLLAAAQDTENPMDGLCRAAAALHRGEATLALDILANTGVAGGEQTSFAAELRQQANRAPVPQSASPSPAPASHLRR